MCGHKNESTFHFVPAHFILDILTFCSTMSGILPTNKIMTMIEHMTYADMAETCRQAVANLPKIGNDVPHEFSQSSFLCARSLDTAVADAIVQYLTSGQWQPMTDELIYTLAFRLHFAAYSFSEMAHWSAAEKEAPWPAVVHIASTAADLWHEGAAMLFSGLLGIGDELHITQFTPPANPQLPELSEQLMKKYL